MTCPTSHIAAGAAAHTQRADGGRLTVSLIAAASGPVQRITTSPQNAIAACISSRAQKLRHPNAVQRERFVSNHLALASRIYLAGDA